MYSFGHFFQEKSSAENCKKSTQARKKKAGKMEGINKSGLLRLGKRQRRANTSLQILETRKEEKGNHRIIES